MAKVPGAQEEFIMDSGATKHIVCNGKLLRNVFATSQVIISVGDGRQVTSKRKGSAIIGTKTSERRCVLQLDNVIYVPEFDCNLISCSGAG